MKKNALDLLLALDKSKVQRPSKKIELKRLSAAAGEPVVFTCQALTMEEMAEVQDISMSVSKRGELEEFNSNAAQIFTVIRGVVTPSLKDKSLLEAYNATTPKQLLEESKLLLPGEITQLYNVISGLSGYGEDSVQELKNE
ncbi:phage tail assembly chaperone [Paenibacillus sp. KN14-4R]|uniref:phage tail assembly chaperone n=1 Tax=Paenibacillus sp. KN14-4R TaxID=3445773 RepID=UPI003F9FE127